MTIKTRALQCVKGTKVTKRTTGFTHFSNAPKSYAPMTLTGEERMVGTQVQYQCDRGGKLEWIAIGRLVLATPENCSMEAVES